MRITHDITCPSCGGLAFDIVKAVYTEDTPLIQQTVQCGQCDQIVTVKVVLFNDHESLSVRIYAARWESK